jgi:hypothetical protein
LIAVVGIGGAICFGLECVRMNAQFHDWLVARPMEMSVDLSKPGEYTTAFHQTCSKAHGESVYLSVASQPESNPPPENISPSFRATLSIADSTGAEIEHAYIDSVQRMMGSEQFDLASFVPFPKGDYTATLDVHVGGPKLEGTRQTLYARYRLCGLEQSPAYVAGAFSFVAGSVGLIFAIGIAPNLWRWGFRRVPNEFRVPMHPKRSIDLDDSY